MTLFGAVLFRAVCAVFSKLFIHFERIRASTLGDVEWIKIIMFGAVRLRAVPAALYELFMHPERIRAATQGVLCLIRLILCQLKYITVYIVLFEKQVVITRPYIYNHFSANPNIIAK